MGCAIITYRFASKNNYDERRKCFLAEIRENSEIIEDCGDDDATTSTVICKLNCGDKDLITKIQALEYDKEDKALFIFLTFKDSISDIYRLENEKIKLDVDLMIKMKTNS